ncbi:hypothetical protein O3M35_010097 [Rhynocoris fuscipes]|uniref:Gustatory receptor n=1 Tax=Rhynocoris fuscipes TaxID=488301 RepID=A0AAW1D5E1_9HEMI
MKQTKLVSNNCLYYKQFQPVIILLQIFGRLQLYSNKNGKFASSIISWRMLYCIVSYLLQTYLVLLPTAKRIRAITADDSNYDKLIFSLHVLTYLSIHFHLPFTFWVQSHQIADYINDWMKFQENWNKLYRKEMKLSLKSTSYSIVFVSIPSIVLFLIFENYSTLHDPWIYLLPHLCTLGSTMLIFCIWYCTCIELGRLSRIMISELSKNLEIRPNSNFLRNWRYLWIDLMSLTSSLGNSFSKIIISIMITYSATFLLGFFNSVTKLVINDTSFKTMGYASATSWSLCIMFLFCDAGHHATYNVSIYIPFLIY